MTSDKSRIRELENELAKRDNTILMLQNSINNLTRQIENLTEVIVQMRHDKFGSSSEKPLGREFVREELQYIPAQLKRLVYFKKSYE